MVNIKSIIENATRKAGEKKTTIVLYVLVTLVAINAIVSIVTSIINL